MICATCGTVVGPDDRFCGGCGQPAPKPSTCPHCGKPTAPDERFCGSCGGRVEPDPPAAAQPHVPNATIAPASVPVRVSVPPSPAADVAPPAPVDAGSGAGARVVMLSVLILAAAGVGLVWWTRSGTDVREPSSDASRFSGSRVFTQGQDPNDRLELLHAALLQYAAEHDGRMPAGLSDPARVRAALQSYVKENDAFMDPRFDLPFVANAALEGLALATLRRDGDPIVFCGAREGSDGWRTAITLAGAIRAVAPAECTALAAH